MSETQVDYSPTIGSIVTELRERVSRLPRRFRGLFSEADAIPAENDALLASAKLEANRDFGLTIHAITLDGTIYDMKPDNIGGLMEVVRITPDRREIAFRTDYIEPRRTHEPFISHKGARSVIPEEDDVEEVVDLLRSLRRATLR